MNAFCPKCQKPVDGVFYSVSDDEFFSSIDTDAEVYVAHTHPDEGEGDHRWKLTDSDKANLRSQRAEASRAAGTS